MGTESYLSWVKRQYAGRWGELAREGRLLNLAVSGMGGVGAGILKKYGVTREAGEGVEMMWGHSGLRGKLAALYGVRSAECVLTVAGGSQALFLVMVALRQVVGEGTEVAVGVPGYGPLFEIPGYLGMRVGEMNEASVGRARLVVVANPNNPTGRMMTRGAIEALLGRMRGDGWLVVDESFLSPGDAARLSAAGLRDPRVIVVGGLTKPLGLGDLRVGWMMGEGEMLDRLREVWVQGFNIGSPWTEGVAAEVLRDIGEHQGVVEGRARENFGVVEEELVRLEGRGLVEWERPGYVGAGIVFVRVGGEAGDGERVYEALLREGVAVVPGVWFGGGYGGWVRVGFGGEAGVVREGMRRFGGVVSVR